MKFIFFFASLLQFQNLGADRLGDFQVIRLSAIVPVGRLLAALHGKINESRRIELRD
jgi:hypothetical protein